MTFVVATLAGRTRGPARERMWVLLKIPISAYYRLLKTVDTEKAVLGRRAESQ